MWRTKRIGAAPRLNGHPRSGQAELHNERFEIGFLMPGLPQSARPPVIATRAALLDKRRPVARPTPLVPQPMRARFPLNLFL